ncbi:MAG: hypothetical protein JNJ61_02730 [Anaerolineae bacterium]|nr:hypothetical protein [Anaerolineae bacterium]
MKILALVLIVLLIGITAPLAAQSVCPAPILLDFARAASTCYGLEREQACVGSAFVSGTGFGGQALESFSQIGQRASINTLQHVDLQGTAFIIPLAVLNLQANLTSAEARQVTLLLIGTATLENGVQPLVERVAFALGTANLRAQPREDGEILARVGVNESIVVNGRSDNGGWLRAQLRDSNTVAWVAADVVAGDGLDALPIVAADAPVYRPFEIMTLTTGGGALCDGALTDGLLLQTPSVDTSVKVTLNGSSLELAGTFFITAESGQLTIYALDGGALLDGVYIPAGSVAVNGVVTGYPANLLPGLPLANLPTFIRVAAPLTDAQIAEAQAAYAAALAAQVAPVAEVTPVVDTTCRRFVRRDVSLYAGPGSFYEAINELQSGTTVDPIFQTTDPQGATWYQLRGSNWIPAAQVVEEGECVAVPVTANIEVPRTNRISLETCQTTNGPLRAGQSVTIQFTPPPWDNYPDARDAAIIDPGHITIGTERYRARATQPLLIAGTIGQEDERWQRQFYVLWEAVPGTFRMEGDRVSYNPICTITVPAT